MPNRIIRDSIKTSLTLASVSDFAERLFFRLTTCMDDFGRYHGHPQAIMSGCFPVGAPGLTIKKIHQALRELETADLIRCFTSDGRKYVYSPTWEKHQRRRATESKFPQPTDSKGCGHLTADDRDSRTSAAVNGSVVVNGNDKEHVSRKHRAERFPDFWAVVRFKQSRSECEQIWRRMGLDEKADTIIAAYKAQLSWSQFQGDSVKFMKRPPSWLRKRRWEDEPEKTAETESERLGRILGWPKEDKT